MGYPLGNYVFRMHRKLKKILVQALACVVCMSQCLAISRQELAEFIQYIDQTSRRFNHPSQNEILQSNDTSGNEWERSGKFEGDMILRPWQRQQIIREVSGRGQTRNGMAKLSTRWPNKEIVYKFKDYDFSRSQMNIVEDAVQIFNRASCVRMRYYKKCDKDKVTPVIIQSSEPGCWANIGYSRKGNVINLERKNSNCFKLKNLLHEFVHIAGFVHMHSNYNRDDYVTVHWENILPRKRKSFMKYGAHQIHDYEVPYDYYSILHYSRKAGSANGEDTLEPIRRGVQHLGNDELSGGDIEKLNLLYECY